jgi:hypothetical protein
LHLDILKHNYLNGNCDEVNNREKRASMMGREDKRTREREGGEHVSKEEGINTLLQ